MKFNTLVCLLLVSFNFGCSSSDPVLPGAREMLDGSAAKEKEDRFIIDSLPALNLPPEKLKTPTNETREDTPGASGSSVEFIHNQNVGVEADILLYQKVQGLAYVRQG